MPDQWRLDLRSFRLRRGLSQAELAKAAGVSTVAIKSYEGGARHPSKATLDAMLDALVVPRFDANRIRREAGYTAQVQRTEGFWFTESELEEEIEAYPWPVFIVYGAMDVLMANKAATCLWNVDLNAEFMEPGARNLVGVASDARFAERVENWEEVVGLILGHIKGGWATGDEMDSLPPDIAEAIARFVAGNPKYLPGLLAAWQNAKPLPPRFRYRYRVDWRDPDAGLMRFRAVVTSASLADELAWNEWVPANAASWNALEEVRSRQNPGRTKVR